LFKEGLINDNQLTYALVTRYGTNDQGKTIRYYLNYSGKDQSLIYNFDKGIDLLTNKALKKGDNISLKPWDVLIVEE
jgi:beta-galactosidase